jgi:hypothetical protein
MVNRRRTNLRLSLITVLIAALVGAWFASTYWTVDPSTLAIPGLDSEGDWVDAASAVGEQAIQFMLGWTNNP